MNAAAGISLRWIGVSACWMCLGCGADWLAADEPDAPAVTRQTATFRRILVPAGQETKWPVGQERYLAIEPKEFERLYREASEDRGGQQVPPSARLVSARYTARLEGDALVGTEAHWTFDAAAGPTFVELGQCNLAVSGVGWTPAERSSPASEVDPGQPRQDVSPSTDPNGAQQTTVPPAVGSARTREIDLAASHAPAILGSRTSGDLVCILGAPGDVTFDWELVAQQDSFGSRRFELIVPRALTSTLVIDLPLNVSPTAVPGTVTAERAAGEGLRRWRIDLGPADYTTLRIAPLAELVERKRLTLVRQTLNYDVSGSGLELVAEHDLDVHYQPLRRIDFVVSPGLQLAAVRYGETSLDWTVIAGGDEGATRVAVDLPEPVLGGGRKLRISARGEVVRGQRWQLPSVKPEGLFWQEGRATIRIGRPLVTSQLFTNRCRQTATAPLPDPMSGESIEVQFFDPQASVELVVDRRAESIAVKEGIRIEILPHMMAASVVADLTAIEGDLLELSADINRAWNVTAIESIPQEALADWSISDGDEEAKQARVRLAHAVSPETPLRLKIHAESVRSASTTTLRSGGLVPLSFRGAVQLKEIVGVAPGAGIALRTTGDVHLKRLDPPADTEEVTGLFDTPLPALLFVKDEAAETLEIEASNQPPRYTSQTRIELLATEGGILETHRFQIRPDSDRVAKVYVRFAQGTAEAVDWNWESAPGESLLARKLTAHECAALGRAASGETWEISLSVPQANPFNLVADRFVSWQDKFIANLSSLPDASLERAQVELFVAADTDVRFQTQLQPVPVARDTQPGSVLSRGAFRYQPPTDADPTAAPALIVEREPSAPARPRLTVWDRELHSRYADSGEGLHAALFRCQNDGARKLRFGLPSSVEVQEVWVEGTRVARHFDAQELLVPLPAEPRFVTVVILFREPVSGLAGDGSVHAPVVELKGPHMPLRYRWFVGLPAGYEIADVTPPATLVDARSTSLADRLLGPLAIHVAYSNANPPAGLQSRTQGAGSSQFRWALASAAPAESIAIAERKGFEIELPASTACRARIMYAPRRLLLTWFCGLGALALTAWRSSAGRWTAVWLLTLTILAILAPESWTTVSGAAWLGAVAAVLVKLLLRLKVNWPGSSVPPANRLPSASGVTLATLAILFVSGFAGRFLTLAGEVKVPKGREDFRIFVPVDSAGNPTNDSYQVPEELYFFLQRAARAHSRTPQGYLWTRAEYVAVFEHDERDKRTRFGRLDAVYELDVLTTPAKVEIPFYRDAANLLPASVKLDGQVIAVSSSADERSIVITINQPGQRRIELGLRPRIQISGEMRRAVLPVPPVMDSVMQLDLPEHAPVVEVRGAAGPVKQLSGQRRKRVALGAVDRLTIEWLEFTSGDDSATEVQQLVWMSVRPGSVVVDAKLKFLLAGQPRTVRVTTDPRLRLLSATLGGSPVEPRTNILSPNTLELDAVPDSSGTATVGASFLLTGTSGIGKLRLPRIEPLGGRVTRRWLALSMDPALEFAEENAATLPPMAVGDFLAAWGEDVPPATSAHLVPSNDVAWSLATRPRETQTQATTRLAVIVGAKRAQVRIDSNLNTVAGYVFQHRLTVPSGFVTENVSVEADNAERCSRWAQHDTNGMTVFLTGPTHGEHHLRVEGWLPIAGNPRLPFPVLLVNDVHADDIEILLYRRPEVLLTLEEAAGLEITENSPATLDVNDDPAILYAHYRMPADQAAPGNLIVVPNQPRVQAIEVTQLSHGQGIWQAEYRCTLDVESGNLDEIVLEIPREWQAPWVCDPEMVVVEQTDTGGDRHRLLITPPKPIHGSWQFSVSAPLRTSSTETLKAPRIELRETAASRQYLIVPERDGERNINWETRGVEPAELPPEAAGIGTAEGCVYRIVDRRAECVLMGIDGVPRKPFVRLADYCVRWANGRPDTGLASFDLAFVDRKTCSLSVPKTCELLQCFVGGVPSKLVEVQPGHWQFPLEPERGLTRIQVLFRARDATRAGSESRVHFAAPALEDFAVEQTLWRVFSALPVGMTPLGSRSVSALEHALVRIRSVAELIDAPGIRAGDNQTADPVRQFHPWATRLQEERHNIEQALAFGSVSEADAARSELAAIDQEQEQLATRLGTTEILQQVRAESLRADHPGRLWEEVFADNPMVAACVATGSQSQLVCAVTPKELRQQLARWSAIGGCLLLLAVAVYTPHLPARFILLANLGPWIALAGIGLMAWLEGAPIWLTIAILFGSALGILGTALSRGPDSAQGVASDFEAGTTVFSPLSDPP